jgi:anaerobic selenocysteine-containing dehydrogenase
LVLQVRIGGDLALLRGVAKAVFEAAESDPDVLDREFIEQYTHGIDEYRALVEATPWAELVRDSGVDEPGIRKLADAYMASERVIVAWCLGLTQHEHGVDTVREIINLLLLRGNIGREGAGPCPIRGHSNVQGNRACGIDPPREHGLGTVATIEAMQSGDVKVFVASGGNFALATPDLAYTSEALRSCELTVQVSTKLNRSHIVHGKRALILPCLGRTDKDEQASGVQWITVENAMSTVHISYGMKAPGSPQLRSECAILVGMAQATLPDSKTPWQGYADDYDRVRDTMRRYWTGSRTSTHAPATLMASVSRSPHGSASSVLPLVARSSRRRPYRTTSIRARAV